MSDTGSEVAEGTTRDAQGVVTRMLERQFMLRERSAHRGGREGTTDIELGVRCPEGEVDARANEVLGALERMGVSATCSIGEGQPPITLGIRPRQGYQALRALELLARRSDAFSLDDVTNIETLETIAGRRALGRPHDAAPRASMDNAIPSTVESVALTFANHPEQPAADSRDAEGYARRMRGLGFDAAHKEISLVRRDPKGDLRRTRACVVGVSYLARDRDDFLTASAVAMRDAGVPMADDPFAGDFSVLARERIRLSASAGERRRAFEANADPGHRADGPVAEDAAKAPLKADEYLALPPRERSRIAPEDVPKGAFGMQRVAQAASEQSAAARALRKGRTPSRSHPAIGER